ncbi:hypothetical protein KC361_g5 [Hortaea werneckii]|nr:hypothetical protein KC361_g5 [Hortaea werneckii]
MTLAVSVLNSRVARLSGIDWEAVDATLDGGLPCHSRDALSYTPTTGECALSSLDAGEGRPCPVAVQGWRSVLFFPTRPGGPPEPARSRFIEPTICSSSRYRLRVIRTATFGYLRRGIACATSPLTPFGGQFS